MSINLFRTNVEELSAELAGTVWEIEDTKLAVERVFVDGYSGGYCVRFDDGSWGRVDNLLKKAQRVK